MVLGSSLHCFATASERDCADDGQKISNKCHISHFRSMKSLQSVNEPTACNYPHCLVTIFPILSSCHGICFCKDADLPRRPLMRCYSTRNNMLNNWHPLLIVWLHTVCSRRLENIIKCLHVDFCSSF